MLNRELVKLLAYLQPPGAAHALAQQIGGNIPDVEKLQIAAYAPRITPGWETADKLIMLRYYEKVRGIEGGHSLAGYIENFARDFFANLTLAERRQVIAAGEHYPTSALSVLAKLPENPGPEVLAEIRALDERLEGKPGEPVARLRVGIVAVLGRQRRGGVARSTCATCTMQRSAAPGAGGDEPHAASGRRELADPGRLAADGGWRAGADDSHGAGRRRSPAGNIRAVSQHDPARPAHARQRRRAGGAAAGKVDRPDAVRARCAAGRSAGGLAELVRRTRSPTSCRPSCPRNRSPTSGAIEELLSYLESPEGKAGSPSRGEKCFTRRSASTAIASTVTAKASVPT